MVQLFDTLAEQKIKTNKTISAATLNSCQYIPDFKLVLKITWWKYRRIMYKTQLVFL